MDERKKLVIRLGKCGKGEKVGNPGENINNKNKVFRKMKRKNCKLKYRLRHWRGLTWTKVIIVTTMDVIQWVLETALWK